MDKRGPDNVVQLDCMVCLGSGKAVDDSGDPYNESGLIVCLNCSGAGKVWAALADGKKEPAGSTERRVPTVRECGSAQRATAPDDLTSQPEGVEGQTDGGDS